MDLIVFDLDGTLLNASASISTYTRDTLRLLADRGILYTVATGRTLHAARDILHGHGFRLPQAFKNGVLIWDPGTDGFRYQSVLTVDELQHVIAAMLSQSVTPFLFTLAEDERQTIYHPPLRDAVEAQLAAEYGRWFGGQVRPMAELPLQARITNISALGPPAAIGAVETMIADEPNLVAYAGIAQEGPDLRWIDIHHVDASKGSAVTRLREELGARRVLVFGDSDNDLSMFGIADESYAPSNAKDELRAAATAVIGHHDEDGIARFLRERFDLDGG